MDTYPLDANDYQQEPWLFGLELALSLDEGSALDRVFISALLLIGLLILIKRHFNWTNGIKDNQWLMLLIGFMLVSVLWSDMPFDIIQALDQGRGCCHCYGFRRRN